MDVNQNSHAEQEDLRVADEERELLLATLLAIHEGISVVDERGVIVFMNAEMARITGYAEAECIGKPFHGFFAGHASFADPSRPDPVARAMAERKPQRSPARASIRSKDGRSIPVSSVYSPVLREDGSVRAVVVSIRDATREAEQERELQGFLDVNVDLLCIADLDGNFVRTNRRFEEVLGYATSEMDGRPFLDLVHPDDVPATLEALRALAAGERITSFANRYRSKDGTYRHFQWQSEPGPGRLIYASARDVTAYRETEEQLRKLAVHDEMTGLYNRRFLDAVSADLMERSDRYGEPLSMLLLDLDHFKRVNDEWGHPIGDEVLKQAARILQDHVRASDTLARFGGEEFVALLPMADAADALAVAEKIRRAIESADFAVAGRLTASFGVAERQASESFRNWYRRVDEALYEAKQEGRNRTVLSSESGAPALASLRIEWQPAWACGHAAIDEQHRALVDEVDRLVEQARSATGRPDCAETMDRFIESIALHFEEEECIFGATAYPGAAEHAVVHQALLRKARRLQRACRQDRLDPATFLGYVRDDLILGHILTQDVEYYPWLPAVGG